LCGGSVGGSDHGLPEALERFSREEPDAEVTRELMVMLRRGSVTSDVVARREKEDHTWRTPREDLNPMW
jgi:hypothetical protein